MGGIRGTVLDSSKVILPGATVQLQKSDSDSVETAYTSAEGQFEFTNLKMGTYSLTVEMPGFQTVSADITIQSGIRNIQITLPEQKSLSEDVTVHGAADDLMQKEDTQGKNEIAEQVLDRAPIAEQRFQDALPLVPSVVRGPDGNINISGSRASESGLLVNGSNVTDPVTGNFAIELPIEAVESVQVFRNPYSAEYGKFTGGVTSVSTKAGEENFKIEVNDLLPRLHYDQGVDGLEAWSPRIRVSGPTSINNLFFSQAIQYKYVRTFLEDLPDDGDFIHLQSFDSLSQIDYKPNDRHQMSFTLSYFPEDIENVNLSTFLPLPSTPDFEQRGFNVGSFDRRIFGDGSFIESSLSYKEYDVRVLPKDGVDDDFHITTEGSTGSYFNSQDRNSSRFQLAEAFTLHPYTWAGSHVFRVGLEYGHTSYSGEVDYLPIEVHRADGSLSERTTAEGLSRIGHSSNELSAYVQDHWSAFDQLTLDWGMRMDYDSLSEAVNFGPRAAFSFSPMAMPKTNFKGGIGLFYDKVYLNAVDFEKYPVRDIETFDDQGNLVSTVRRINQMEAVKTPHSWAWNLEANQQITPGWLLRTGFLMRQGRSQFLLNVLPDSLLLNNEGHSRYLEWELTSQYKIAPESNLYVSYVRSSARGDYNDFDNYLGNFQKPVIRENAYTQLSFDTPNRLLFWGVIKAPYAIFVSPILEVRNGFPYSAVDELQNFVGERNSYRFPTFTQLDLRVTRTFRVFSKYDVTVGGKIFNALNTFNPRDVQNNINSPSFGTFYNTLHRTYRLAFEIKY